MQNPDIVSAEIASDIREVLKGGKAKTKASSPTVTVNGDKVMVDSTPIPPRESVVAKSSRKARQPAVSNKYTVKSGDTLMKISFEKYGNLYRWRDIYSSNKDLIPNYNNLQAGTELTIEGVEYVVIQQNGNSYLIRKNDTLIKISNKLYGTPSGWKGLWANNSQLIRDPNKIYAGFNLYYLPLNEMPTSAPKLSYNNRQQQEKLKYIQSLRKPASNK